MNFDIKKKTNFVNKSTKPLNSKQAVSQSKSSSSTVQRAPVVKDSEDDNDDKVDKNVIEYASTVLNADDIEKLLVGYDMVPREGWLLMPSGISIRYTTNDGDFRRGGYIHNILQPKPPRPGMIFLENYKDKNAPGYKKWPIVINNIKTIWKQRTLEDVSHKLSSNNLHNVADSLQSQINGIKEDIKKLTLAIKRVYDKLHEISSK